MRVGRYLPLCAALAACGSDDGNSGKPATSGLSTGTEIGSGDGSPGSVVFAEVYKALPTSEVVDVGFATNDPTQLWVLGYADDTMTVGTGVAMDQPGTWKKYHDPAAPHFMHKPPAFAMGAAPFWGVCGDNDNTQNDVRGDGTSQYFMGPALFTTDLAIFTRQNIATGLGSHYDMLHNTSFCRGIAHIEANQFWVFNGQLGSLDRYNFNQPHEPGGDDHSDGEIYRYAEGQVKGVEGVSSHLFYDNTDKMLYIADTGNHRVAKLDTTQGTPKGELPLRNERLKAQGVVTDARVEDVVPAGTLDQPSGIEVHGNLIFVTDAATGFFYAFDKTGKQIRKLDTGLGAGALSGFTFGPEGRIWFTNRKTGLVARIDPGTPPAP
jgi:hypothetical protein